MVLSARSSGSVKFTLAIFLFFLPLSVVKADKILLRDGSEIKCNVQLINDNDIKYHLPKNDQLLSVATLDVYMVQFDKRGNVYISDKGKRITGERQSIPTGADVVYLVEGREIPAFSLEVNEHSITFLEKKPSKKNIPDARVLPLSKVFKIVYKDGSIDLINDLSLKSSNNIAASESKDEEAEYQAILYAVGRNETLSDIATKHDVLCSDIIEWNDLASSYTPTSLIPEGKNLMIYVKVIK